MYFSSPTSTSSLQGETYFEEMNWMVVLPNVVLTSKNPSNTGISSVQELSIGIGSISTTQYDTTSPLGPQSLPRPTSTSIVPTSDSFATDVPKVCIGSEVNINNLINDYVSVCDRSRYQLPPCGNRGKPPKRCSLDNS